MTAEHSVRTADPFYYVIAEVAVDQVVAVLPKNSIIVLATVHGVVTRATSNVVIAEIAINYIGTRVGGRSPMVSCPWPP